jgi:branched-chain amino acid aminotransferase
VIVFLNGQFVPEEQAVVSVFDRSFLYGDGLFETIRIFRGRPFRWADHMERFRRGADFLKIRIPHEADELLAFTVQLIERNRLPDSLLRITLSRGVGLRGYSPRGANQPTLVISLHPAPAITQPPPAWRVIIASVRLPASEPLAEFKTGNKLPQILARAEADAAGADEALLLNTNGEVVEGSSSNLFWIKDSTICTPPLPSGILPGVTRLVVSEICHCLALTRRETSITPAELPQSDGAFLSLSSQGIIEIAALNGFNLARSPLTAKIRDAYLSLTQTKSSAPD